MKKRVQSYLFPHKGNEYKPHMFRGLSTFFLVALVVLLLVVTAASTVFVRTSGLLGAVYPSVLVDLANEARVKNNDTPLTVNQTLVSAAQMKANDMAEKGYFAHTSPEGLTPWYWIGRSGYQFIYAGENLAVDFTESKDVNRAWLNSPGHAANILSPNFTEVGIATAEGVFEGKNTIYVVQVFGTPAPQIPTNINKKVSGTQVTEEPASAQKPVEKEVAPLEPEPKVTVVTQSTTPDELFVVGRNDDISPEVEVETKTDNNGTVAQSEAPGYERYANWYDWLVLHPAQATEYALYAAAALIACALLLMVCINVRVQHPRNLLYGVFILIVLLIVIYLNRIGVATELVSKYFM